MDGETKTESAIEVAPMPPESTAYQLAQLAAERDEARAVLAATTAAASKAKAEEARVALERALTEGGVYEVENPVDLTGATYKRRRV